MTLAQTVGRRSIFPGGVGLYSGLTGTVKHGSLCCCAVLTYENPLCTKPGTEFILTTSGASGVKGSSSMIFCLTVDLSLASRLGAICLTMDELPSVLSVSLLSTPLLPALGSRDSMVVVEILADTLDFICSVVDGGSQGL